MAMSMTTKYSIPENAVVVGLCAGRHDMPVGEFIFPTEVDPTDFRAMSRTVDVFLDTRVGTHLSNYPSFRCIRQRQNSERDLMI